MFGSSSVPHVVDRRLVRAVEIALQRLVHDARARAGVAVVQVDDGAIERERLLDVAPVALVGGDVGGAAIGDRCARRHDPLEPVGIERDRAERPDRQQPVARSRVERS